MTHTYNIICLKIGILMYRILKLLGRLNGCWPEGTGALERVVTHTLCSI